MQHRLLRRQDPARHFVETGWRTLRAPSLRFDLWHYWATHLDPTGDQVDPLLHYLLVGRHAGLAALPEPQPARTPTSYAPGQAVRRACLFAGYDADGLVDDYVVDYLTELARHADVFYVADGVLEPGELDRLDGIVAGAWSVPHGAYDFGSFSLLARDLVGWERLDGYDEVILANDSCYLLRPLDEVLARDGRPRLRLVEPAGDLDGARRVVRRRRRADPARRGQGPLPGPAAVDRRALPAPVVVLPRLPPPRARRPRLPVAARPRGRPGRQDAGDPQVRGRHQPLPHRRRLRLRHLHPRALRVPPALLPALLRAGRARLPAGQAQLPGGEPAPRARPRAVARAAHRAAARPATWPPSGPTSTGSVPVDRLHEAHDIRLDTDGRRRLIPRRAVWGGALRTLDRESPTFEHWWAFVASPDHRAPRPRACARSSTRSATTRASARSSCPARAGCPTTSAATTSSCCRSTPSTASTRSSAAGASWSTASPTSPSTCRSRRRATTSCTSASGVPVLAPRRVPHPGRGVAQGARRRGHLAGRRPRAQRRRPGPGARPRRGRRGCRATTSWSASTCRPTWPPRRRACATWSATDGSWSGGRTPASGALHPRRGGPAGRLGPRARRRRRRPRAARRPDGRLDTHPRGRRRAQPVRAQRPVVERRPPGRVRGRHRPLPGGVRRAGHRHAAARAGAGPPVRRRAWRRSSAATAGRSPGRSRPSTTCSPASRRSPTAAGRPRHRPRAAGRRAARRARRVALRPADARARPALSRCSAGRWTTVLPVERPVEVGLGQVLAVVRRR